MCPPRPGGARGAASAVRAGLCCRQRPIGSAHIQLLWRGRCRVGAGRFPARGFRPELAPWRDQGGAKRKRISAHLSTQVSARGAASQDLQQSSEFGRPLHCIAPLPAARAPGEASSAARCHFARLRLLPPLHDQPQALPWRCLCFHASSRPARRSQRVWRCREPSGSNPGISRRTCAARARTLRTLRPAPL